MMVTTVEPALVPPDISRGKTRVLAVSRNRTDCQLLAILRLGLAMGEQAGTRRLSALLPVTAQGQPSQALGAKWGELG